MEKLIISQTENIKGEKRGLLLIQSSTSQIENWNSRGFLALGFGKPSMNVGFDSEIHLSYPISGRSYGSIIGASLTANVIVKDRILPSLWLR